ncbi:MAG: iron-sulfur cluster co-chaperone HscB C-terminal domain-containing protein [Phycisphaerales bacterium]
MPPPNPFQLLGLPARFEVDEASLRRAYLAKVSAIHPDLADADDSQGASADLNRAREALANPESRANILLSLLGGPAKEADKSLPPAFLMEMMETREAIEAALASGQANERAKWTAWGIEQRASYIAQVGAQFRALDPVAPTAANFKTIRTTLNAWRYIERLIEQLDPAYDPDRADFKS